MRPSSGGINIAASAQKLDVDNRISLRYYYRIADNILKQVSLLYLLLFFWGLFFISVFMKWIGD